LVANDLDSVSELYTQDDFGQLVVAIEAAPAFLGCLGEFEDHGERGGGGLAAARGGGAVPRRLGLRLGGRRASRSW
jgi:hypothetical protein